MVRFGIAGFGLHATRRLMPGFAQAENCRVTALSRRNLQQARQSAAQYNIPLAFDSTEKLCQSPEVDAVFVTTPNASHLPDTLAAIRSGKPVLCEKPMGMNAAECRQMVEAARQSKVLLGVAQIFRFENSTAALRDWIAEGRIGKPVFARSEFSLQVGPQHPRAWIRDPAIAGGGPLADVGVHCIDTLRFILRDEVVRVSAQGRFDRDTGNVENAATLLLEFAQGTLGLVLVSFQTEYRTPLEVVGTEATLRGDDALNVDKPIALELRRGGAAVEVSTVSNASAYARQVKAFAAAVEGKAAFPVPGDQGWQNQLILDAAYRSIRTGHAEDVPRIRTWGGPG